MKSNLILAVSLLALVCGGSACSCPKATGTLPTSVTASQQQPPSAAQRDLASRLVQAARSQFEAGKLDAADKLLQAALELEPDDQKAQYYLGLVGKAQAKSTQSPSDAVGLWYSTLPPRPAGR